MRILLVTQFYQPEPIPYISATARALVEYGHEVEVLTSFPCYPHGKLFEGYTPQFYSSEQIDGVQVHRVKQIPDHSRSIIKRAIYYFSFAFFAMLIGPFKVKKPDVILVYQSAMPTGIAALFLGLMKRSPVVLNVVDLWPESVAASGMCKSPLLLGFLRGIMKLIYRGATHICVITKGYRENLLNMGIPASKISVVYYWIPEQTSKKARLSSQSQPHEQTKVTVAYTGNMGTCQHLQTVLEAAELLQTTHPEINFMLIGSGTEAERLSQIVTQRNLTQVQLFGWQKPDQVTSLLEQADLLLVHLKPDPMSRISIPSKTMDYLKRGKAILMGVAGEATELVEEHQCGITFEPCNAAAMANAILRYKDMSVFQRQQMDQAVLKAYQKKFCDKVQLEVLHRILIEITQRNEKNNFHSQQLILSSQKASTKPQATNSTYSVQKRA